MWVVMLLANVVFALPLLVIVPVRITTVMTVTGRFIFLGANKTMRDNLIGSMLIVAVSLYAPVAVVSIAGGWLAYALVSHGLGLAIGLLPLVNVAAFVIGARWFYKAFTSKDRLQPKKLDPTNQAL
jgi:hypothetical protein